MSKKFMVIAHNIRSTHNVGSIFRTSDGFGVEHLYLTGYTPYPTQPGDERLPHIRDKLTAQIHKTALGAEATLPSSYQEDVTQVITRLKAEGYVIAALEQSPRAILLPDYQKVPEKCALLLGEEVHGISLDLLAQTDVILEIPMKGHKESFNVSVAFGIAAYHLCQ